MCHISLNPNFKRNDHFHYFSQQHQLTFEIFQLDAAVHCSVVHSSILKAVHHLLNNSSNASPRMAI
ncbi:hypothetical protein T10_12688 [Trichinella papuae]|uniref:Uncharacterized protein n=1 Tax=Trichinella papuae TaxID=268474 RepID=A0A0V1MVD2_9BILA|nr:hypothetical protein T10_12688 [Trichinella papuae]